MLFVYLTALVAVHSFALSSNLRRVHAVQKKFVMHSTDETLSTSSNAELVSSTHSVEERGSRDESGSSMHSADDEGEVELVSSKEGSEEGSKEESMRYVAIFNPSELDISLENPFGEAVKSISSAEKELITILTGGAGEDINRSDFLKCRVEYLVKVLSSSYIPSFTMEFLALIHKGSWEHAYR